MTDHAATHPLLVEARADLPAIVAVRRRLHRHPEVGLELPWTQAAVAEAVEGLGLAPALGRSVGSVTATIEGERPGPTILLRADMDGLPLHEDTGLDFASEIDGRMHACGHDTHVAMLLGGARLLLRRRAQLRGRVLLMFQPGEEGFHGARSMLEEGLLDTAAAAPVTRAFAIHISTQYATGAVHLRAGALLASSDTIRLTVRGRGGHASAPHAALDPIAVAAEIVLALQAMVGRRIDVFDPAVVTIARFAAGTTSNIIPETAVLEGTFRTVSDETRATVRRRIGEVADGICAAHGATAELEIEAGYPVTVNDAAVAASVADTAAALVGVADVAEMPSPIMGAEDFSYVLQRVPGAMAFLGATPRDDDPTTAPANHSNRVVFDEAALPVGAALYAAVALEHLAG
jgi:hippurate hydrolase